MDPNRTLANIRAMLDLARKSGQRGETETATARLAELAESFEALDEWLSRGGFAPDDWRLIERLKPASS